MSIAVGIDASRNRSGGARSRLAGVLGAGEPTRHGIDQVHVWAHRGLLDELPDAPWLTKHDPPALERSLPSEVWWQLWSLPTALRRNSCDVLLSMDAGTVSQFQPAVVMSRDMLSFEPGEMARYAYSRAYWRLLVLKHVQMSSMSRAAGALFLTNYAATVVQRYTGPLTNVRIVPHGIGESFRRQPPRDTWSEPRVRIDCLYVSHVDLYKHQWQVVRAVAKLRRENYPLVLTLIGRASGRAGELLHRVIAEEAAAQFVELVEEVPHAAIAAYLARADLFVFASSCENMPNTLIEAMAIGLPIACSDRGPMPEVLQDGGTYFDPEDPDSIAAALRELLKHRERRQASAVRARALAAKYSWARCADETWRFLAEVASTRVREAACTRTGELGTETRMSRDPQQRAYAICANCVMDTSDSSITFDERGWCDHCNNFYSNILPNWVTDSRGEQELLRKADIIKRDGAGRDHDCILGISGGVDSSYLAYIAKERLGLRPLAFHVDAGWNSQQAANNIEKIVDALGLDLHTEVVDWLEMKDLQLAFFKAQVPHLDTPQDHAFVAALYNFAAKHKFKYILNGGNLSTECIREPLEWHYHASDLRHLLDIHRRFGRRPLKTFPLADIFTYKLYYRYVKGVRVLRPLNSVPYIKSEAMQFLADRFGWQPYGHKHYESRFTRFYEAYWLPTKFGYDKRRAHFSSLILTKQMTREEALELLARPAYDETTIEQDFEYVATKLDLTVPELQSFLHGPKKSYRDYKSAMPLIQLGTHVLRAVGIERTIIR